MYLYCVHSTFCPVPRQRRQGDRDGREGRGRGGAETEETEKWTQREGEGYRWKDRGTAKDRGGRWGERTIYRERRIMTTNQRAKKGEKETDREEAERTERERERERETERDTDRD